MADIKKELKKKLNPRALNQEVLLLLWAVGINLVPRPTVSEPPAFWGVEFML